MKWNLKLKTENWKLKLEIENWNWYLRFDIENWNLKLKIELGVKQEQGYSVSGSKVEVEKLNTNSNAKCLW